MSRIPFGSTYKFVYDGLIINFNAEPVNPTDIYYWLDQIEAQTLIIPVPTKPENNSTLSLTHINILANNRRMMRIYHPAHCLDVGLPSLSADPDRSTGTCRHHQLHTHY